MCKVQAAAARADMSAFYDVIREQDMADYLRNEKKKTYLDSIVEIHSTDFTSAHYISMGNVRVAVKPSHAFPKSSCFIFVTHTMIRHSCN